MRTSESMAADYKRLDRERKDWSASRYASFDCQKCGRQRVLECQNGKHWCEKCYWVVEDKEYFTPEWT